MGGGSGSRPHPDLKITLVGGEATFCAEGTGTEVQRPQRSQRGAAVATVGVEVLVRNRQIVAVARASLTTDLSYTQLNIKPGARLIRC